MVETFPKDTQGHYLGYEFKSFYDLNDQTINHCEEAKKFVCSFMDKFNLLSIDVYIDNRQRNNLTVSILEEIETLVINLRDKSCRLRMRI